MTFRYHTRSDDTDFEGRYPTDPERAYDRNMVAGVPGGNLARLDDLVSGSAYPGGVRPSPRQNAPPEDEDEPCDACDGLSHFHSHACHVRIQRARRAEFESRALRYDSLRAMGLVLPGQGDVWALVALPASAIHEMDLDLS